MAQGDGLPRMTSSDALSSAELSRQGDGATNGAAAGQHASRGVDKSWMFWLFVGPAILYLLAFAIYPLFYSLRLSFTDLTAASGTGHWVGLENYYNLVRDPFFWNAARNSVIMVGATVIIEVVLGTALALFFNLQLRGAWIVRGILALPMLITPIVVGVMWRALLNPDWGLINWAIAAVGLEPPNWLGSIEMAMKTLILVDAWQWTPFVFIVVFARLQALPQDVFEAAQVDGIGPFSTFWHVTLPLLSPAILFAAIFRAVDGFRAFDLIYGLTYGGPGRSTATLAWFAFQNGFEFQNYGYAAAVSYSMLAILIVGTTLLLRYAPLRPRHIR